MDGQDWPMWLVELVWKETSSTSNICKLTFFWEARYGWLIAMLLPHVAGKESLVVRGQKAKCVCKYKVNIFQFTSIRWT